MNKEYIDALKESLQKKIRILTETYDLCKMQSDIIAADNFDTDAFDRLVDDKDVCIEKIENLDKGFETVYDRIKDELSKNRSSYATDIKDMQTLIERVTDLSASIMALEERNRNGMSNALIKERKGYMDAKRSVNVAMNYYKNMNGLNIADYQYINKKK